MTKKKTVVLAVTIPMAVILIALLCLIWIFGIPIFIVFIDNYQYRGWSKLDFCEYQWEITLPKDNVTIEYNFSNRGGFHGDGTEYTVCKYSARPNEFLENFKKDVNGKFKEKYNRILPMMKSGNRRNEYLDESKLFSPDDDLLWQSKLRNSCSTLLLAYDESTDTLYIIEDFI